MNRIYDIQLNLSPNPNVYALGGGFGNFFKGIGNWVGHPFDKTARYNASVQSNPNSYGSGEITNFNTTGNGTTDWGSMGGFATGQTSQNNITNPYQGTTIMEQDFAQTGTPTAETVDGDAFSNISESGRSEGTWTRGGGGIPWGAIVSAAGTNIANAFLDTEASTAERVAGVMGIPALANQWRTDTSKGDANISEMTNRINNATNRLIQDSNDTQGAFAAIKNNNNLNLIDTSGFKTPTLKDFKGNWWKNMGASVAQGAASGSVGGPWGAVGGAWTGLLGSIGGLFGRKKRAQRALDKYKDDMSYLQRFAGNFNSFQRLNQQQSNENLLNNGLKQQRIQDLANIRAYGGNLFDDGGDLGDDYIYEGRMLPEAVVEAESMPWYEKWYNKSKRALGRGWDNVKKVMSTPTMTALPGQSPTFQGQFFPTMPSTVGDDSEYALSIMSAPWDMEGIGQAAWVLKHPKEAAKLMKQPVDKLVEWAKKKTSKEASNKLINEINGVSNNVLNMPSNGNYIPSKNYFYSQIDNPSTAKYIAEVEGNPAFQTRPFSKFYPEDETLSYLRHNSLGRTRKYGTDSFSPKQIDEFDKAFNNYMKDYDYQTFNSQKWEKAGKKDLAGFHNPENKYIAIVEDYKIPPKDIKRHEVRHAYDNYGDILSNKQHDILDNAYGSDFVDLPKNIDETDPLKGYSNMFLEKTTTNLDARKALLKGREETTSIDVQNMIIDKMTDEKIIEAVRNSNGYGKRYIKYLEENNLLTPQKVQAFRDAMKYVGAGAGIELINNNIKAMGGQFDYNLSPNMIDLQNQSLANQKYKYINQIQPVGFVDSGPGKIPNPGIPRLACGGKLHLNKFDFGGSMNGMDIPTGMQSYENGGTHEENPNGGIQVGVDNQGTPNLVEEGEFRWGDYVFSNRIDVDLDVLSDFNVPATKRQGKKANKGKLSYADLAKKMAKKAGDLNDPITKDTLNENMKRASQAQDFQKAQMNSDNQLADYKNALKNQTQGNSMYGSMKYSGMGNVNQGLNEGSSAMEGVDNSSLSNVNRSGNAMMAAYGGNLYPDGGNIIISNTGVEFRKQPNGTWMSANGDTWSDEEMQQFVDNGDATMRPITVNPAIAVANDITKMYNPELSPRESYAQQFNSPTWTNANGVTPMNPLYNIDVNLGFGQAQNGALGNGNIYNQQFGLGIRPDYVASKNPNKTVEAVSTYGKNVNGQIQYDPNGNPVMLYPNTFKGMNGKEQPMNSTFGSPINTTFTLNPINVDNKGFYKFGNTQNTNTGTSTNTSSPTNGSSYSSTSSYSKTVSRNQGANENMPEIPPAESTQEGLPNSKDQAGIVDNRNLDEKHAQFATATTPTVPTLNTKGLYAQLGKGALKNIYNWAGLANTEFTPNNKPEQDLRALGKTGYVGRTDDHSGMYREANLFDINLANNAAQAQAAATARAMSNVNDRNQRAANQLAADYNAALGIGNNYQTMFDANMKSRLATDEYNKQTEQTNVAANNDMYRDNQNAGIQAKNFELSANTAANQMQWAKDQYADTQNRIAALNKQSDAARMADNQINFLVDKAKENAYYNLKNKDPRQMYWNDPSTGEWHFKGDNGYYNNLRRAMSGTGINSLDTTSNEELAAMADQKGWNNITEEDMKDIIDRQAEREKKISDDKKAKDAQDLRNAQIQYKQMLANIRAVNPDYNPGFKDSDFTTADDWLTGYNGLNTYWLSAINPYLANRKVDNENAYGGKIKTNKRNKNHSYDYMAI